MALLTKKKFSFTSKATDKDSFAVVSFKGFEAVSIPYQFEIVLVSEKKNIDPLQVLQNPAVFTIHRDNEQDVIFNGILIQFEETQEFNGYLFFKAVLAPKLQWLSLTHHNQVFLDQTAPEIMEAALKDGDLVSGIDFEFRLQNDYQPFEYICQYGESHLNFVARWAEREGIYYFFEQTKQGEKVVFTDTNISQTDLVLGKDLIYSPQSGLDSLHTKEVIKEFLCKHSLLPQRVFLKDYNYRKPSLAMEGSAEVDPDGRGENYIYGEHFPTPEEGNRLAGIRAEELLCRKSLFFGKSSVPFIVPGFTFDLQEHYQKLYNRKYLITDVNHEGHQTGFLISGVTAALQPRDEQMFYANTFTAIYSDAQFRPERTAVKPKISGTINAKIDAATSGKYAELDDQGRYKVILPFDRSGRGSGKASAWCRMMQPYSGADYGMHFPQHKGGEVLLTFIDGDPDRPIIAGAVPNPETKTPVTSGNQTQSVIRTGGGNQIRIEDGEGGQQIHMSSPTSNSIISLGDVNEGNIFLRSDGTWVSKIGANNTTNIGGDSKLEITGDDEQVVGGNQGIKVTGDQDTVVRNQELRVNADRTVTVIGAEKKSVKGNSWCKVDGPKSEMKVGASHEVCVAAKSTQQLAATQELFVGLKATQNLAATSEVTAGIKHTRTKVKEIKIGSEKLSKYLGEKKEEIGNYELETFTTLDLKGGTIITIKADTKIVLQAPDVVIDGNLIANKKVLAKKDLEVKGTAKDKNSSRD
ncbi:MAG: type VI secretion system Vgr family protein [Candidatus Electrothrix sp. YB6]